ncbi:Dabb family protein [Thalassobius sp. Cn5-15]|jgi:quinol monooxygenase YgiN|uniref:Dabb family protein n=1 Tax=Thalassobius sp. Cn5-15 TaxID=2917763 RepID=UPI001EF2C44C|nr:Dabb family protein [Thalassobius sp. Cn5-15]MCG7494277.1 Dabb family protein [Thalassobius sp. Cn5-15]
MLRHIVFFTARDPKDCDTIFDGLSLLTQSTHANHLEVGRNLKSDPIDGVVPDFVVYGEFEDEAQLAAFKADPLYQKSIDRVRPLRDMRMAADFLTG